jgi:hypothetical protein
MRTLLVALVVVFASACASAADGTTRSPTGVITEPGQLGLVHLRAGDCIRDPLSDVVEAMVGVPCSRDHRAQVVAVATADEFDLDDAAALGQFCEVPAAEIGRGLLDRTDLPEIDVAVLLAEDGERVACVLEFAESVSEDIVRRAA